MNYPVLGFPAISPLDSGNRPFWSVMIPTYNSGVYLEETLRSILVQDPGEHQMQIEIVDDGSPIESARETLRKLGLESRVGYYRQPRNLGLAGNWNTCIQRARGEVVHILHQDDLVLPGFYHRMKNVFEIEPSVGATFCQSKAINDGQVSDVITLQGFQEGILPNWLDMIAVKNKLLTPSIAVRRSVYESLGGYCPELIFALDWEMWVRIANSYPVWYIPEPLAVYRGHNQSETIRINKTGENIRDRVRSFVVRRNYLAPEIIKRTEKKARRICSKMAFRHASSWLDQRDFRTASIQIWEGLRCNPSIFTLYDLLAMLTAFVCKHSGYRIQRLFHVQTR